MGTALATGAADEVDGARDAERPIAGWAGLLVPYDQASVDGRVIRRPPGGARVRQLPIELKFQEAATCGHDGALVGLANITKTWEDERGLWGSGEFDMGDPRARDLARKIAAGFAGHVSVDLGDFQVARQQMAGSGQPVDAVTDWKLLSTTIVADAAMDGARIYAVTDPAQITPTDQVLAARRKADGVFSADGGTRCKLTFARTPDPLPGESGVTLTITRATGLPWAPRDTRWDGAGAARRVAALCGGTGSIDPSCYGRAFLYRDAGSDPSLVGSYKFPFADVINGRLTAVLGGIRAAAQRVDSAGITSADKDAVRGALRGLYGEAARALKDDTITAPFAAEERLAMASTDDPDTEPGTADLADAVQRAEIDADALAAAIAGRLADAIRDAVRDALDGADGDDGAPDVDDLPGDADDDPDMILPQAADDVATATVRVVAQVVQPQMGAAALRMARAMGNRKARTAA